MEKQILAHPTESPAISDLPWVDLETSAHARLTSEDPAHPIEAALRQDSSRGWVAAQPGPQTIWFSFPTPQRVDQIYLRFEVAEARTQEFVILCSTDGGVSYRELVRQQFNFSTGAPCEEENYFPNVSAATDLKLVIVPDISGGESRATLRAFRIR
jgi:hypothetical protein